MKIYRNSYRAIDGDGHKGYRYFASLQHARRAAIEVAEYLESETDSFDVPRLKSGVIAVLNRYGSHPDNG